MRIEVVQSDHTQPWRARIKGANGEILLWSENYTRRSAAVEAIIATARTFGIRGQTVLKGAVGNEMLTFSQSSPQNPLGAELSFVIHDVDERVK